MIETLESRRLLAAAPLASVSSTLSISGVYANSSAPSVVVNPLTTNSGQTASPTTSPNAASTGGLSLAGKIAPASNLPFDDSGLAPPSLVATCALPNLPVYNVKNYGATGNGVTDDTVAIRNALAAAEAAGGGIIYLPAGTYNVCPQASDLTNTEYYANPDYGYNLPIFVITTSNIVFIGDGAGATHLEGYSLGMKNPVTNWYSPTPGGAVVRFDMFQIYSSTAISTIQFRSLDICGNAGWTPNGIYGENPANPATGDGWDISNKCIKVNGNDIDNVLVFNCTLHAFRGEVVYEGGDNVGKLSVINTDIYSSNGDAVSASADVLMSNDTIGGNTPGSDVYNGVENFCLGAPEKTVIQDCSISCSSNSADPHGNAVAYLGTNTSNLTVEGTTFSNNMTSILLAQLASNIVIQGNTFANNSNGVLDSYSVMYADEPIGFSNCTISDNTFNQSGAAFASQAYYDTTPPYPCPPFTNLVLQGNTVTNGSLLSGAFFSANPGAWTGFDVENNALGVGATDFQQFDGGNNFAVWTNTVRTNPAYPAPLDAAGVWVNDSTSETTTTIEPRTDLTVLNTNQTSGTQYVAISPTILGNYPVGYQTELVAVTDKNWVLKADPTWNTFTANQAVGPNGLWIEVNAQGLFTLMPVLSGIEGGSLPYAENGSAAAVTTALTVSDPNSTTLAGATVQISGNYQSGADVLSFANTAKISGSWNAATGILTLSGSDTLADYQAALQSVKYFDNSSNANSTARTVSFQVNDGLVESNVVTRQIAVAPVNYPPVLAAIETAPLVYAGGSPVTSAITASDAESTTLAGATIQISGNYRNGEDTLSFTNTATITGNWNAITGVLTLSGSDTLADYQAALR